MTNNHIIVSEEGHEMGGEQCKENRVHKNPLLSVDAKKKIQEGIKGEAEFCLKGHCSLLFGSDGQILVKSRG